VLSAAEFRCAMLSAILFPRRWFQDAGDEATLRVSRHCGADRLSVAASRFRPFLYRATIIASKAFGTTDFSLLGHSD
jgi:hypothetical protein